MNNTPNYDSKVKKILDSLKPGEETCSVTGKKWEMTEEEIGWYKKFNVPPAGIEPLTRMEINTSFYSGYEWWNHKHPKTGKPIITYVHPATRIKVLPDKEWHAEDFSNEGMDYKLDKSMFEQMRELQLKVPLPAWRNIKEPENSICIASYGDRNSYFTLVSRTENSLFNVWVEGAERSAMINSCINISDSFYVNNSANVTNSTFVSTSKDIISSEFVFFSEDLEYCYGASNQRHKKYLWFDEQLTKEEWEKRRAEVDLGCRDELKKWVMKWREHMEKDVIWPENMNVHADNCFGEYLYGSRDLQYVYDGSNNSHDMFWCAHVFKSSNAAFVAGMSESEDAYESDNVSYSRNIKFSFSTYYCQSVEYCFVCYNCENCFGCFGLNRKKFHIFNKEYSEEEYWKKLDEIKCAMLERGEYGKFFPLSMSPAYFEQSGAVLYYGTDPNVCPNLGGLCFDPESNGAIGEELEGVELTDSNEVPNCIDDLDDSWAGKPLIDKARGRRYAMIKPEIEFYRRKNLAPPTSHFVFRVIDLMHESNVGVYEEAKCEKCSKKITVAKNLKYPERRFNCMDCHLKFREGR